MINGSIYQENITILNMNAYNNRRSKYIMPKLMEIKGEIEIIIIIIFQYSSLRDDGKRREKISKDMEDFTWFSMWKILKNL